MKVAWRWGALRGTEPRPVSPVLKIGGSLLTRPDWPAALADLVRQIERPLLVVGGGSVVNGLRAIETVNPRPPQLMHDLAIDAMTLTARIVANALDLPLVTTCHSTTPAILEVSAWLRSPESPGNIPATWDFTSDSLAAAAAVTSHRPLVLAKSLPPPLPTSSLACLADAGWVDACFPDLAAPLKTIMWVATE